MGNGYTAHQEWCTAHQRVVYVTSDMSSTYIKERFTYLHGWAGHGHTAHIMTALIWRTTSIPKPPLAESANCKI